MNDFIKDGIEYMKKFGIPENKIVVTEGTESYSYNGLSCSKCIDSYRISGYCIFCKKDGSRHLAKYKLNCPIDISGNKQFLDGLYQNGFKEFYIHFQSETTTSFRELVQLIHIDEEFYVKSLSKFKERYERHQTENDECDDVLSVPSDQKLEWIRKDSYLSTSFRKYWMRLASCIVEKIWHSNDRVYPIIITKGTLDGKSAPCRYTDIWTEDTRKSMNAGFAPAEYVYHSIDAVYAYILNKWITIW